VESIPNIRKGDPAHVQGFILYKLWLTGCWARGGGHGKSIDLEHDLPTNYDKKYKSTVLHQAEELKSMGLINIWPAAGGRRAIAAIISEEAIKAGLPIVNDYAKSVGEEPLEGTIREIITGKRSERKSPLSQEELHKFARMHKQAEKP
jgi:hypothetical protein